MGTGFQMMREQFDAQFEIVDGDRYLYRHNQKGEPIPVTTEERNRFIGQYVRRIRFILGGLIAALLAFFGLIFWQVAKTGAGIPETILYVGIGAVVVVATALMYGVKEAPARELEGRASVGRERSKEEMQAILLDKLSYGQLAAGAAVSLLLPFNLKSHVDVFHGAGRLWLVLSGGLLVLVAVQAFRKWRFEQERSED